ncbi:helix-turn-helix domain-containing protein [Camelliibacillus cellulosilyticus]|uniref:Helix-turn-helix domain-containing protein n=1 Tax=Camelliibacillus cellulosilyticus TaxID=2174486 RepID=A0ABV9GPH4_9BACL
MSKPMLGQIERAQSNPTVSTLWKIAQGLNVPFTAFIEETEEDVLLVNEEDLTAITEDHDRYEVLPVFPQTPEQPFEVYKVALHPGCNYASTPHPTGVKEYLWITHGEVMVEIGGESYRVIAGQGLKFKADQPHSYLNQAGTSAEMIMIIYYP